MLYNKYKFTIRNRVTRRYEGVIDVKVWFWQDDTDAITKADKLVGLMNRNKTSKKQVIITAYEKL